MAESTAKKTDPKEPRPLAMFNSSVQLCGARYSPCGDYLVGGGHEGLVHRWELTGEEPREMAPLSGHGGWVESLAFAPVGKLLFSGDSWGRLRAWHYTDESADPVWSLDDAHDGWLRGMAVSPDGKLLATCGRDQAVRLWDTATGKKVRDLTGHNEEVFCVLFHPDGQSLVSGDLKGIVKQWEVATGKPVRDFDAKALYMSSRLQDSGGVRCLAFDIDGKTLACGGTKVSHGGSVQGSPTVLIFAWDTGKQTKSLAFGPDKEVFVVDVNLQIPGLLILATCGSPGSGQLVFQWLDEAKPLSVSTKASNTQAFSLHPEGDRLAVTGTNPNSNSNGRPKGPYNGNWSPIHLLAMPEAILEKIGKPTA